MSMLGINQAQMSQRETEAALRAAQKALLGLETMLVPDPDTLTAARQSLRDAEAAVKTAAAQVEAERQAQRAALTPLLAGDEEDCKTAEGVVAGLTQKALLDFLNDRLFPYLRDLRGTPEREVIRQIFEETPSKMVKSGVTLREAIDVVDGIDFHASENVHTLSHLYESLLVRMGREGGMSGEFYTPRPVIRFMVEMVAPQLGETVYDPAAGSAGFLVEAYSYMAEHHVHLAADQRKLQDITFFGQEKKPLPYLLGVMNCVLHGITVPRIVRTNTLSADVRKFSERDRYHVILTNPPFGGTENVDAVKSNFPYPSSATSIDRHSSTFTMLGASPDADHTAAIQPHYPGPAGDDWPGDDAGHLPLGRAGRQLPHRAALFQHGGGLEPSPLATHQDASAPDASHLPAGG